MIKSKKNVSTFSVISKTKAMSLLALKFKIKNMHAQLSSLWTTWWKVIQCFLRQSELKLFKFQILLHNHYYNVKIYHSMVSLKLKQYSIFTRITWYTVCPPRFIVFYLELSHKSHVKSIHVCSLNTAWAG